MGQPLKALKPARYRKQTVAGLVMGVRRKRNRQGEHFAIISLDDRTARLDVMVNAALYQQVKEQLQEDAVLIIEGEVAEDTFNGGIKMNADAIKPLVAARMERARGIKVHLQADDQATQRLRQLHEQLQACRQADGLPVVIAYENDRVQGQLRLGEAWNVVPEDGLLELLAGQKIPVEIVYPSF